MRAIPAILILALVAGIACAQQAPSRPVQKGLKATPAQYVAFATYSTPVSDFGPAIPKAFAELQNACRDNGYRPLLTATVVVRMDAPPQAGQAIPWEVWVPIADQPSEEDLAPEAVVKVKQIAEAKVAYTYHVGSVADVAGTYIDLVSWVMGQALEPIGEARIVLMGQESDQSEQNLVLECQFTIKGMPVN